MKRFLDKAVKEFPAAENLGDHGIVHYHILCDGGFPLTTYMQKPFNQAEASTSVKKSYFNKCFSSSRRVVESAFGVLTSRFRLFTRALQCKPRHCNLQIVAAVILHNLLMGRCTTSEAVARFPPESFSQNGPIVCSEPLADVSEAHVERDRLTNYFAERDNIL
ncbi:unnamed protein product [Nippostrongylus brasiliensis]|uniref:DDE Tnp4 domain-containing protein n=1 Tax=Nippostrongylus brasiliensis TaxID=27835 RepID=A0A0N4YG72_NIPBR|nr:unnamed protein product [Nippostrongylus brasiliensis]